MVATVNGWRADQVATLCDGRVLQQGSAAEGIATDSRSVRPNQLFVALRGDQHDGHDFVQEAFARGAAGAVVAKAEGLVAPPGRFLVQVADTVTALLELAREHRQRHLRVKVVAITGSCGKTTTKDMLSAILSGALSVVRSPKSFNNHVGVPLTLFELEPATQAAVVEIGTSAPGEIARLSAVARPDIGIVTCIAPSHLKALGSVEGVAKEKSQLVRALTKSGTAILNGDDPRVAEMAAHTEASKQFVRIGSEADWFATSVRCHDDGTSFLLQGKWPVHLRRVGVHNVYNALCAIAAAKVLGVKSRSALQLLAEQPASPHRLEPRRLGQVTLFDDTYNMNPGSAQAALRLLHDLPGTGRRLAVFGEMLDLGPTAADLHRALGVSAAREGVDLLMTVGDGAKAIADGAIHAGMTATQVVAARDADDALSQLMRLVTPGDRLLCKASRAVGLERLVEGLAARLGAPVT